MSQPGVCSESPLSSRITFPWGMRGEMTVCKGRWKKSVSFIFGNLKAWFQRWFFVCLFLGCFSPWLLVFRVVVDGRWPRLTVVLLSRHTKSWDKIQMSDFEMRVLHFFFGYWRNWMNTQILNCKYKSSPCSDNARASFPSGWSRSITTNHLSEVMLSPASS